MEDPEVIMITSPMKDTHIEPIAKDHDQAALLIVMLTPQCRNHIR